LALSICCGTFPKTEEKDLPDSVIRLTIKFFVDDKLNSVFVIYISVLNFEDSGIEVYLPSLLLFLE